MTRCGKGWTLNCSHDRPYDSNNKDHKEQMITRNGVKCYEVTADKKYVDVYKDVHGKANSPNPDTPNKADKIKVTLYCNEKTCSATLDGKTAEHNKNGQHSWIVDHKKITLRHKDPDRNSYKFLNTLKEALTFHNDENLEPESHSLKIDGEEININVYPGDYYTLVMKFPAARNTKYSRGAKVKEEIPGPDDTGKSIEKGVQKGHSESKRTQIEHQPGDKPMGKSVRQRVEDFFKVDRDENGEKIIVMKGITDNAKTGLPETAEKEGPLTVTIRDSPVVLLHNDEPVRLTALDSVFTVIKLIERLLLIVKEMAESTPTVGWYFDLDASFLSGRMVVQWGFVEAQNDYSVERYSVRGVDLNLVKLNLELGFGIKSHKHNCEAVLFLKLKANGTMKNAFKYPPSSDVRNAGHEKVIVDATPSTGGRIKLGKILTIEAMAQITFTLTCTFNPYFSNENDYLTKTDLEMSPVALNAKMTSGKYSIVHYQSTFTEQKSVTIKSPDPGRQEARDQDLGVAGFEERITHYLTKAREGKLDIPLRVNLWGSQWPQPGEVVAKYVIEAMRKALGADYELLDFTDRTAEAIVRDLAKMCGASRFSSKLWTHWHERHWHITWDKFADVIALTNIGAGGDLSLKTNPSMFEQDYDNQGAEYRKQYGNNNREQFLNMLAQYRHPGKIYEKQLTKGDKEGTIPPELKST